MIDTSLTGMRCRATSELRSHRGLIRRWTEGTIRHDIDNLGRRLISVQWDGGITDYVFPSEIEIIAAEEVLANSPVDTQHNPTLDGDRGIKIDTVRTGSPVEMRKVKFVLATQ